MAEIMAAFWAEPPDAMAPAPDSARREASTLPMPCRDWRDQRRTQFVTHHRDEDDLGAGRARHVLQRLELANLDGRRGAEDVRGLPHEAGAVDLGAGGDDLPPLALTTAKMALF